MRRYLLAIALLCVASPAFASNAYIVEFAALGGALNGPPQIAALPPLTHQKVDFSGGAASSSAFSAGTKFIRVHCDAACSIRVGGSAATTAFLRIPLDGIEYFGVQPGDTISVIANP